MADHLVWLGAWPNEKKKKQKKKQKKEKQKTKKVWPLGWSYLWFKITCGMVLEFLSAMLD